jgi:thiol-disulfide isomerase/thioredoxin
MSPLQRAGGLLAAVATTLLVAACGGPSTAGDRVTPGASSAGVSVGGPAPTPPADLVASAELADCPATDAGAAVRDDGLPDLTLPCLGDGPDVRLAGLRGTPTVVNLWASWCSPCRDELPLFADLAASGRVRVLGIAVQDDPGASLSLLADVDVHYASAMDFDGSTKGALRWVGLPMTLFVDSDGVVTHVERGQITSVEQLDSLVAQTLGVEVPS